MIRIPRRKLIAIMPWVVFFGLLLFWQAFVDVFGIREFVLPAPSAILASFIKYNWPIIDHMRWTLITTLIGFGLAIVGGMLIGIAVGYSTLVYKCLYPLLVGFNAIPKVAVAPILVLWFGIGVLPAVIMAFIISFFPIVVNVATGIATMEPEMADVLRSMGASNREVLTKVAIPRSLPYLFASLKVAITLSFVGSVLAETIAGNAGLGYLMVTASARFDAPLVFAGLIAVAALAVSLYAVCVIVEKRMTRWAFRGELVL